jgi:hypothetical protein
MRPVINKPTKNFDFTEIQLTKPLTEGSNYLIKYLLKEHEQPFYIQTPRCYTKKGIQKVGKKYYCDLLFSSSIHEEFVSWVENLEKYSQDCIFQNREKWFETSLEMEDIDNFFSSSFKIFKSGKFYSLHTQIMTEEGGQCNLYIYNSQKSKINIEDVKEMTPVIAILEVVGIKCVPKGFHILWEMKQMMIMGQQEESFQNCLISMGTTTTGTAEAENMIQEKVKEYEGTKCIPTDESTLKDIEGMDQNGSPKEKTNIPSRSALLNIKEIIRAPSVAQRILNITENESVENVGKVWKDEGKYRDSPERSVGEYQFAVACQGELKDSSPLLPPLMESRPKNTIGDMEEVDIVMEENDFRIAPISSKEKQVQNQYIQQFQKLLNKIKESKEEINKWIQEAKHIKEEYLKDEPHIGGEINDF